MAGMGGAAHSDSNGTMSGEMNGDMNQVSEAPLRVLVADDHALVRAGVRSILAGEADMEGIEEAANGREAVAIAPRDKPDVVLMDVRMPLLDGIEATRLITTNPA